MVVSFVNSGLMTLTQAAGVIFGANIGTTVTALLVSFKLEKAAPVILLTGVLIVMFCKKEKLSRWGEVIIGFGVLFMGLSTMSGAMSGMKDSPAVVHMFASLRTPFLAVILGAVRHHPEFFRHRQYHGSAREPGADGNGYRYVYHSGL